jgi:4-amino-4-deoxychorismate lyase
MMLINGQAGQAIDARDRGLHYGDGLFETIAVVSGRPQLWTLHLERLSLGCRRLRLSLPEEMLSEEAHGLCADQAWGVLKIILTRGPGERGYRFSPGRCTRLVGFQPAAPYPIRHYREGIVVRLCTTRIGLSPALAGLKHLNRLEQVMARAEWDDEYAEGLMQDANGNVIEGTMSNVFALIDGRLWTPSLSQSGVAGVMRRFILERSADLGVETHEAPLSLEMLRHAQEVFVCNSLIGVWPVSRIEDAAFEIGAVTKRIMTEVRPYSLMP